MAVLLLAVLLFLSGCACCKTGERPPSGEAGSHAVDSDHRLASYRHQSDWRENGGFNDKGTGAGGL